MDRQIFNLNGELSGDRTTAYQDGELFTDKHRYILLRGAICRQNHGVLG